MQAASNTCKNCGNVFTGKYCNQCGEKKYREEDKYIPHLFEDAFHFTTHFEGKFFNTLGAVVSRPGKLSFDYCNGLRKKYFKPISFFLMLVILYLLFPLFEGLNMRLKYHVTHDLYGEWAMKKTLEVMQAKNLTEEKMADLFHQKGEKTSKFLLFLIIPVMGIVSWLLGYKKRKLYFDHFVFGIEVSSFFILWGFLFLPLVFLISRKSGLGYLFNSESVTGLMILTGSFFYVLLASRRFFKFKWWYSILYSLIYILFMAFFIQWIYKFILFVVAINLI
ncbi:MAG: DUF3667 domain-containing protein [Flavisolibacter sp.]